MKLPKGFRAEPLTFETAPPAVEMYNTYGRRVVGHDTDQLEWDINIWKTPGFSLEQDTHLVYAPDRRVVAYVEVWDLMQNHVRIDSWGVVHPDFWGQGLGRHLLSWAEERARLSVPRAPEGAQVVFQQSVDSRDEAAARLFLSSGYQPVRQAWVMMIEFDHEIQPVPARDGLVLRPMRAGEERELVAAVDDAFKDHWGHVDEPFERIFERFMHRLEDPFTERAYWFVAEDQGQIAGASLCAWGTPQDQELGWVNTLGVRRPWRKRGVGLALLLHSFHELKKIGKHGAGLGVDSSSLTGATRLYEKGGMQVAERKDLYRKELRPGVDLTTQGVE